MKPSMQTSELISALADGQLGGDDFAAALHACRQDGSAVASWDTYHLIGDALRSPASPARSADMAFMARLNQRLAGNPLPGLLPTLFATWFMFLPRMCPTVAVRPPTTAISAGSWLRGSLRWRQYRPSHGMPPACSRPLRRRNLPRHRFPSKCWSLRRKAPWCATHGLKNCWPLTSNWAAPRPCKSLLAFCAMPHLRPRAMPGAERAVGRTRRFAIS